MKAKINSWFRGVNKKPREAPEKGEQQGSEQSEALQPEKTQGQ